jgi:enoyl-CoA hydratase
VTPAALTRSVLLAEIFTPDNAVETGFLDLVVDESELMTTAIEFAKSTSSLNADAHTHSKKRLRADVIAAIREGLTKDYDGWKKQFL